MKLIKPLLGVFTLSTLLFGNAYADMPKSQILLADLNAPYGLKVILVGDNNSYNNQPYLVNNDLYFTHEVLANNQSQTDIVHYNLTTREITNLTNTAVSEYSPTLMPDKESLSAVVVEADSKQKLWQYPLDQQSAEPRRIFDWIEPVGYHAWGGNNDLVMFILGQSHTLQYTTVDVAKGKVVASDIGRTLIFNPDTERFLFTYNKDGENRLASFNPQNNQVDDILRLPEQVQDFILKEGDTIAYAIKNRVYQRKLDGSQGVSQWLDLSTYCETTITRMSYNNNKLAFVCDATK